MVEANFHTFYTNSLPSQSNILHEVNSKVFTSLDSLVLAVSEKHRSRQGGLKY